MRNYRHIIRSVKYYPRKYDVKPVVEKQEEPAITESVEVQNNTIQTKKEPIKIEKKIDKVVNTQQLDDFEAEYQAFIADLKAKKEKEKREKEEAEQLKMADDFEAEYQAFIEELKMKKEQNETSTEETIVQD